jgi:putative ABC transport system permease protein
MDLSRLIIKNLLRHRLRTALTVLGVAIAILAFSLLRTVIASWYVGVESSSPDRLITRHAVSLIFPLPLSYRDQIKMIPGVTEASYANWFAGIYIDEKHSQFPQFAVEPHSWLTLYPELSIPEDQKEAFLKERNAALVGAKLAQHNGWKVGDRITMQGMIYPGEWGFVIRAVYTGARPNTDETWFMFHWAYLDEQLRQRAPFMAGYVGWYTVKIADPSDSSQISLAIDERFKNSLAETLTETERSFMLEFISMMEAILVALKVVSFLIVAVILAVLANTMAMTARERLSEYAVLKTLGFGAVHLVGMIVGESLIISVSGGGLGILLSYPAAEAFWKALGDMAGALFPAFRVSPLTVTLCGLIAVGVGLTAAAFPAYRAVTLRIADGLRRIG